MLREFRCVLLFAWFIISAVPATAVTLFVDPAGDDANDCLSTSTPCRTLQEAVNRAGEGDQVRLAGGTYGEQVSIRSKRALTIIGGSGVVVTPPSPPPVFPPIFHITHSESIVLEDLTIRGNGIADFSQGLQVEHSTDVELTRCTVEEMGGGGMFILRLATVRLSDSIIRSNRFHGLRVDAPASLEVIGAPFSQGVSRIEDNLFAGVLTRGGDFQFLGAVRFAGNAVGIWADGGSVFSCCDEGNRDFIGNEIGIRMHGGELSHRGPSRIEGNHSAGIRLVGASAVLNRFNSLAVRVVIRGNGSDEEGTGGIVATASDLELFGADVTENLGRGVLLQDNSSMRVFNSTVTANTGEGVRLEANSTVRIFEPAVFQDNGGFDLSCSTGSYATGEQKRIQRRSCPRFGQ